MNQEFDIIISDLCISRGSDEILLGANLKVKKGEILCLLGPDGSGKTTIIEILVGLLRPKSGKVSIMGYNIHVKQEMREIKKIIGVLPQEFNTHENLTVKENIQFWGKMYDKRLEIDSIFDLFDLRKVSNVRCRNLTLNQKMKVGLALAFVNDPDIVFLDEPTRGLDQFAKKEVWEIIRGFKKKGKTIVIATNYAIDPQIIADRVAIIHKGSIKDIGAPEELIDRYSRGNKLIIRFTSDTEREKAIQTLQSECPLEIINDDIVISSDEITLPEVLTKLDKGKVRYSDIITQTPTLNDTFITLTGEKLTNS